MKKITLLLVIIFTFLFSTTSWGEWSYLFKNVDGSKYYYDKDRIRKSGKFLYVWELIDYIKPIGGYLSSTRYVELDCSILRYKMLKIQVYKNSKGEGKMTGEGSPKDELRYPKPKSVSEYMYNRICKEYQHLSSTVIGDNDKGETLFVNRGKKKKGVLYWGERNGKRGFFTEKWGGVESEDNKDLAKYEGEIKNGVPNGQGTSTWYDGRKYVGGWKDGSWNGQGTFTWFDGREYVGGWKDGKSHGHGTTTYLDGRKYVGEYKNGQRNGQGTMTYPDGGKYAGEWKNGRGHGQATFTYPDGKKYFGQLKDGKQNGQGTLTSPDGQKYVGEWKDGKKHGQATFISPDGTRYVGEYKDDKMNGQGRMTLPDGEKYVGEFKDGNPWNGTVYQKDGNILGEVVNGEQQ